MNAAIMLMRQKSFVNSSSKKKEQNRSKSSVAIKLSLSAHKIKCLCLQITILTEEARFSRLSNEPILLLSQHTVSGQSESFHFHCAHAQQLHFPLKASAEGHIYLFKHFESEVAISRWLSRAVGD